MRRGLSIGLEFNPSDLWIGVYWRMEKSYWGEMQDGGRPLRLKTRHEWDVFICLIPTLPIRLSWIREMDGWPVGVDHLDFGLGDVSKRPA